MFQYKNLKKHHMPLALQSVVM